MARLKHIFVALSMITALVGSGCIAQAATIFNDQDNFLMNLQPGFDVENFNGLDLGPLSTSLPLGGSGFNYSASGIRPPPPPPGTPEFLYGEGSVADVWLSTVNSNINIVFDFSGSTTQVTAVGGYFFLNNEALAFIAGTIAFTLSDGTFFPLSVDPTASDFPPFVGFTTQVPITSLTVAVPILPACNMDRLLCGFATVNDLHVGIGVPIAQVPEPSALALLLAGVMLLIRRKVR